MPLNMPRIRPVTDHYDYDDVQRIHIVVFPNCEYLKRTCPEPAKSEIARKIRRLFCKSENTENIRGPEKRQGLFKS